MRIVITLAALFLTTLGCTQKTMLAARVDSITEQYVESVGPGLSIGVVENGEIVYSRGVGLANIENATPNSDTTIFGIASVAKQLTAACIWSLIQEKKISLDDDIRMYIPEFPFYGEIIRIRHMLNHTSGIRNYHAIMDLAGFLYNEEYYDNEFVLRLACKQHGLNNRPGEKVIYGNTSYTLLAMIIERISGQNINEYAQRNIFDPLGMNHTYYRIDTTSIVQHLALGYVENSDHTYSHVSSSQLSYGAGSVGSSIEDLAIWSNVLNGLTPEYLDLTVFLTSTEELSSGDSAKYARGVMVDEYRQKGTIHHSGYGLGGQSQLIAIPELKLAVIVLTNLESIDPSPLSYEVIDLFLPHEQTTQLLSPTIFEHKRSDLLKFTGYFQEMNSDMKMEIFLENDTLKSRVNQGKKSIPLSSAGLGKFVRQNNPSVHYDFVPNRKTQCDLIVYFGGTPFYFSRAKFVDASSIHVHDYQGKYFSEELEVEYDIVVEDGSLWVSYPNHPKIKLIHGQSDEFGNGNRVLYQFDRNRKMKVTKFYLAAEGTVSNIEFIKQ